MNTKRFIILGFLFGGMVFSLPAAEEACDCSGQEEVSLPSLGQIELELIEARLRKGQFAESFELLGRSSNPDPRREKIRQVLDHYLALCGQWAEQEQEAHRDRLAKLAEYRAAYEAGEPEEPEKVFTLLAQIKQFSEAEAQPLIEEAWIGALLEQTKETFKHLKSEGSYARAYSQGLRWLLFFDPNDTDLQDRAETLLEMAEIRQALSPTDCSGQEVAYQQADPAVLMTGLYVLEQNYLREPDYFTMAEGILRRSERLGRVLQGPVEPSIFTVDPNQIGVWQEVVDSIYDRTLQQGKLTRRDCERLVEELLALNEKTLKLPAGFLVFQWSRAALKALDPYTEIVWPAESGDFDKRMTGQFAGVGIRLSTEGGRLKVTDVLPDTPAFENGQLKPEDWITAIDGESTENLSILCAVQKISGPEGTPVHLTVHRADPPEEFKVELVRRRIVIPTLQGSSGSQYRPTPDTMMCYRIDSDPGIGYIRVDRFGPRTAESLRRLLESLEQKGLKGLILDLRSNSGGLLDVSAQVTDLFLSEGTIVKTQPRSGTAMQFEADAHQLIEGCPLVVLINEGTASGAEIAAGALAGPGRPRAVLVGTRTYGKGSVQEIEPLAADGSRMKYTRSLYLLSDNRKVPNHYEVEKAGGRDWGIAPDVPVEISADRWEEIRKIQSRLRQGDADDPDKLEAVESLAENDPQLAAGLAILKTQLIAGGYDLKTAPDTVIASTPAEPEPMVGDPNSLQAAQ